MFIHYKHLNLECKYTTAKEALSSVLVFIFVFGALTIRRIVFYQIKRTKFRKFQNQFSLNLPKNQDMILKLHQHFQY